MSLLLILSFFLIKYRNFSDRSQSLVFIISLSVTLKNDNESIWPDLII